MWVPLQVHGTSDVYLWLSKHRAMKEYAGMDVQILSLLSSILNLDVSTLLPLFSPGKVRQVPNGCELFHCRSKSCGPAVKRTRIPRSGVLFTV